MIRRVFTILPIFGILLCPFACMGTGKVIQHAVTPHVVSFGCGCCGHETAPCGDSIPLNENPTAPDDDCHQCVCNVVVESAAKPLPLSAGLGLPADWAMPTSRDRQPILAVHHTRHFRNATHPDLSSGVAMRLTFASLVI